MSNVKWQMSKLILVLGVFLWAAFPVLALPPKKQPTPLPTPTPAKVDYFLVYPGILPDHFLYPIKMVRDRIWLFLTADPLRKAETLLLFADKRLGAGKALIEGGKEQLGISTLTKAEKYLERAIAQERIASQKGKDTTAFLEKLLLATKKHEEVLLELGRSDLLHYPRQGYEEVRRRLGK